MSLIRCFSHWRFSPGVRRGGDRDNPPSGVPSRQDTKGQGHILVVDNDPMTLRQVRDILSRAVYTPRVTTDPDEALRLFQAERPRLVLVDLPLPGGDGIELMGRMLPLAEVPVVFISAYNRDETIAHALDIGAADYIVKPFSPPKGARPRSSRRTAMMSTSRARRQAASKRWAVLRSPPSAAACVPTRSWPKAGGC